MKQNIDIISTASLPDEGLQRLAQHGFHTEVIPFINTYSSVSLSNIQKIRALEKYKATVIFSSAHGVEAVAGCLLHTPAWKIACISGQTQKTVEKYFESPDIIAAAPDAAQLAEALLNLAEEPVIFFCGSRRLDILPDHFKKAGIGLQEIEVYRTDLTPTQINSSNAKAVLFFSTSAVESFFTVNALPESTICFAIGNTTAAALKQKVNNEIQIADKPGKKEMIDLVIKYYHEHS